MGREEQSRRPHRLHHVARRERQIDCGRRSAGRHRPRHHVASRLEHPHPPGAARAARRRHRRADQEVRPDQPGRRISRQEQGRVARRSDRGRQPGQAVLLALRSLQAACRHRSAGHVPGRRVEIRQGGDRQVDLGPLSRVARRSCTRPASRSACRWVRPPTRSIGSAACSMRTASVFIDEKDNIKINSDRDPAGDGISPARSWKQARRKFMPGTTPATIAG